MNFTIVDSPPLAIVTAPSWGAERQLAAGGDHDMALAPRLHRGRGHVGGSRRPAAVKNADKFAADLRALGHTIDEFAGDLPDFIDMAYV